MITQFTIKNYALIEDIQVNFQEGLTIITGETGAGKSILLGALSLLLGKRADLSSVKVKTNKCVIEASFHITAYQLEQLFKTHDIDYEHHTIIRREILPTGKSRAFINDTPVNLTSLNTIGQKLIDIHNQHQTLEVSTHQFQFEIVDALANTKKEVLQYQNRLAEFKQIEKTLEELQQQKIQTQKEKDFNQFLWQELEQAQLKSDEQETLELEYEKLNNVEQIQEQLAQILHLFDNEQLGVLLSLNEIKSKTNKLKTLSKSFETLGERVQSSHLELEDIFNEFLSENEATEANPNRLQQINERLQTLYKLQSKHQVQSVKDLLIIQDELAAKLAYTENLDNQIEEKTLALKEETQQLTALAKTIHNKRAAIIDKLIASLEKNLAQLGLPNARFQIQLQRVERFLENGSDQLSFLFTANKGTAFGPLKKVASGGELSRIMLAVKALLANYSELPTIVFDEIDTGVSGDIANKIAHMLKAMSSKMQVISITHLPQIAAKANHHYKVYKEDINNKTQTNLKLLDTENRIVELAEMLGGGKQSQSAIAHARELLN